MASFKFEGMIPDDDPRYNEGFSIIISLGLNEKPKKTKKIMKRLANKVGRLGQDS